MHTAYTHTTHGAAGLRLSRRWKGHRTHTHAHGHTDTVQQGSGSPDVGRGAAHAHERRVTTSYSLAGRSRAHGLPCWVERVPAGRALRDVAVVARGVIYSLVRRAPYGDGRVPAASR